VHQKRDEEICALVTSGATMTFTASLYGITRERVRQVVLRDTSLTGRSIRASRKKQRLQQRIESDFRDTVNAVLRNDWKCDVCGGWNLRRGHAYIQGKRDHLPYQRCSKECSRLFGKLRFRFERDTYNTYQAKSVLLRSDVNKHQRQHASNILDGTNVEHAERYYTQSGSKNEIAMNRVVELRKALGTEHLFDDSFPLRVLIVP